MHIQFGEMNSLCFDMSIYYRIKFKFEKIEIEWKNYKNIYLY